MKLFQFFALAAVAIGTTLAVARDSRVVIEMIPMRDGGYFLFLLCIFISAELFSPY
jgi:hypothetical protein